MSETAPNVNQPIRIRFRRGYSIPTDDGGHREHPDDVMMLVTLHPPLVPESMVTHSISSPEVPGVPSDETIAWPNATFARFGVEVAEYLARKDA